MGLVTFSDVAFAGAGFVATGAVAVGTGGFVVVPRADAGVGAGVGVEVGLVLEVVADAGISFFFMFVSEVSR
jgi:hypothetical protein